MRMVWLSKICVRLCAAWLNYGVPPWVCVCLCVTITVYWLNVAPLKMRGGVNCQALGNTPLVSRSYCSFSAHRLTHVCTDTHTHTCSVTGRLPLGLIHKSVYLGHQRKKKATDMLCIFLWLADILASAKERASLIHPLRHIYHTCPKDTPVPTEVVNWPTFPSLSRCQWCD